MEDISGLSAIKSRTQREKRYTCASINFVWIFNFGCRLSTDLWITNPVSTSEADRNTTNLPEDESIPIYASDPVLTIFFLSETLSSSCFFKRTVTAAFLLLRWISAKWWRKTFVIMSAGITKKSVCRLKISEYNISIKQAATRNTFIFDRTLSSRKASQVPHKSSSTTFQ